MKRKVTRALVLACALTLTVGCRSEDNGNYPDGNNLTVTIRDDTWIYVSLSEGKVVGTGRLGVAGDDESWSVRSDWDVAFCGNMIRTNSGSSGNGKGGIMVMEGFDFYDIITAPLSGYQTDRDDTIVK